MNGHGRIWVLAVIAASVAVLLNGCSFKKNAPEQPFPSEARVSKAFFETKDSKGQAKLKTFVAGWSPEMSAGNYSSEVFVHYNYAQHTNVVFVIEEGKLLGKAVQPSFIDDAETCLMRDSARGKACRERWENIIEIPIEKHFYIEREKDSRGRETDVYTENTNRSHWSARPFMNLDFSGIKINKWALGILWGGHVVDSITDVEWDDKDGFMAFTMEAHSTAYAGGSDVQGMFRFNFLQFEHDKNFEITRYRPGNAKYINILHVLGKQAEGDPTNPMYYAAHWDTSEKHTIWLWGFPEEYQQIGRDVINEWNDAFEKVGKGRPFDVAIADRKYAFDLRYPTITWVDDRRLSASAPLGVGMALADVRNGEIKWGGVTVWGGMLQEYINRNSPNAAASGLASAYGRQPIVQLSLMEPKRILPGIRTAVPENLLNGTSFESVRASLIGQFQSRKQYIQDMIAGSSVPEFLAANPETEVASDETGDIAQQTEESLKHQMASIDDFLSLKRLDTGMAIVDEMADGLVGLANRMNMMATQVGPLDKVYNADFVQSLIQMPTLAQSAYDLPVTDPMAYREMMAKGTPTRDTMLNFIREQSIPSELPGAASFCADRRLYDQIDDYTMGMAAGNVDKVEAMRSVIKDLLLHEVGHMLGLGHNFKENILPKRGTVPDVSETVGLYKPFTMNALEHEAYNGEKNYTTVMGYKDGAVDVTMNYDELTPGPNDLLSLHYLYNQQYPIYLTNAKGAGDYKFEKLAIDGVVRETVERNGLEYRPAYFPACNDFTASRGDDPYCARWDRGYNASTIVQNHFTSYRGNLISQLSAFTDSVKSDAYWSHEYYLWYKSFTRFSRVRIFYDYMRKTYESQIRRIVDSGSEKGIKNLLEFSETCQGIRAGTEVKNEELKEMFLANPELEDLCVAGAMVVNELGQLMALPGADYTQIDTSNKFTSFVTGGDARASFGRAFGTWKELARMPIKISSLLTLTAPFPYSQWGGWTVPIKEYSNQDAAYHISTLYPKEYTAAVASAAEMNLNLGNAAMNESTSIGRTVMAMGSFLNYTWFSNDVLTVGAPYVQNIRNQTQFRYSYAIVEVEKEVEEGKQIARKFTGTIHNQYQRGPEKVPEIYIYTNDRVVLRPPPGSLLMPMSSMRWFSKTNGYFYAIKMDYTDEFFDRLKTNSVRRTLNETYQEVVKKCIQGEGRNGLRFFFSKDVSDSVFPGFEFPDTIADREDSKNRFLRSVESEFDRYYENADKYFPIQPTRQQCEDAIRGQSLIVMAASVLNGYYFFNIYDYLQKDQSW